MQPKRLIADAVVGVDVKNCLVLAAHPDERMEPDNEDPSLTRRTLVLEYDGARARYVTTLPSAVHRGWTSASGAGYCSAVSGRHVYVYADGQWQQEQFSRHDEEINHIWGLSGRDWRGDILYVTTDSKLFIRRDGQWSAVAPPRSARPLFGLHGLGAEEIYVCTDSELMAWNGSEFVALEDPPPDRVESVLVFDKWIYAGDSVLLRGSAETGWEYCKPEIPEVMALLEIDGKVAVGTFETGVFETTAKGMKRVTPKFMCLALQGVGSGAFACGDEIGYMRIDGAWSELILPRCETGGMPLDES